MDPFDECRKRAIVGKKHLDDFAASLDWRTDKDKSPGASPPQANPGD